VVGPMLQVYKPHDLNKGGAGDLVHRVSSAVPV
jgi:hypothetical protein